MFNGLVEDWVTDGLGVGYQRLIGEQRVGLPTVRLEADFRAVSRFGDSVDAWRSRSSASARAR